MFKIRLLSVDFNVFSGTDLVPENALLTFYMSSFGKKNKILYCLIFLSFWSELSRILSRDIYVSTLMYWKREKS